MAEAGQSFTWLPVLGTQLTQWTPPSPDCSPFCPAGYRVFPACHKRHAAASASVPARAAVYLVLADLAPAQAVAMSKFWPQIGEVLIPDLV